MKWAITNLNSLCFSGCERFLNSHLKRVSVEHFFWNSGPDTSTRSIRLRWLKWRRRWRPRDRHWKSWRLNQKTFTKQQSDQILTYSHSSVRVPATHHQFPNTRLQMANTMTLHEYTHSERYFRSERIRLFRKTHINIMKNSWATRLKRFSSVLFYLTEEYLWNRPQTQLGHMCNLIKQIKLFFTNINTFFFLLGFTRYSIHLQIHIRSVKTIKV